MNKSEINVMMVGARRAGKTSLLASLSQTFNDIPGSSMVLNQNLMNDDSIDKALTAMKNIFNKHSFGESFTTRDDVITTDTIHKYDFNLAVASNSKSSKHSICFIDVPGEWIAPPDSMNETERKNRIEKVKEIFSISDIVLIAIDSVMMIEKEGIYNSQCNSPEKITRWLKEMLTTAETKKMIMFIPLKFETYYYSENWSKVISKTKVVYADLINFLTKDQFKNYYHITIVPALTIGGLVYSEMKTENSIGVAQYTFRDDKAVYEPMFCEQILICILEYIEQMIKYGKKGWKRKNFKLWWNNFILRCFSIKTDTLFLNEIKSLKKHKITTEPFEIVQNILRD